MLRIFRPLLKNLVQVSRVLRPYQSLPGTSGAPENFKMSYFPLFVLWNVRDIAEEYCSTCQQMKSSQKCQEIFLPVGSRPFDLWFLGPSSSRAGNTLSRTASSSSPRPHWCSSHGQLGIRTFYSPISVMVSKRVGDSPHLPRQMSDAKMINATRGSRGFILPDDES